MNELSIEEKQLLLQDICARLPYGIVVQQSAKYPENHFMHSVADKWQTEPHDFRIIGVEGTNTLITDKRKEERLYAKGIVSSPITICIYNNLTKQIAKPYLRSRSSMTKEELEELSHYENSVQRTDFYYSHHIDCRYMIDNDLAIEAPNNMYKIN